MLSSFRAELHVHTVLSPCAEIEMIPPLIVQEALERGIDIIAITDHNSSANVEAVQKAAEGTSLVVLPGMELQTQEEIHLLALFESISQLQRWQDFVDAHLPDFLNDPDYFGGQFVVNDQGEFIRHEERLLLVSTDITLEEAAQKINLLGGLPIPAHIDRKAYGLLPVLGFIPPRLPAPALEVSRNYHPETQSGNPPTIDGYPIIQSGDVHTLDQFLGANIFTLESPTLPEIRKAFVHQDGRDFHVTFNHS